MKKVLALLSGAFLTLGFFGCSSMTDSNDKVITEDLSPVVTIKIQSNLRTINPNTVVTDLKNLTLKATDESGKEYTCFEDKTYSEVNESSFTFILPKAGKYSFKLTGHINEMSYSCNIEKEIVAGNNSLEFSLALTSVGTYGEGKGKINVTVIPENKNISKVKAELLDMNKESADPEEEVISKIADYSGLKSYTYGKEVPTGTYMLTFKFFDENSLLLGIYSELVNVSNGLESNAERTVDAKWIYGVPVDKVEAYLGTLEENTIDTAYEVIITDENPDLSTISAAIENSGKYVNLDLSLCTGLTEIKDSVVHEDNVENNSFYYCKHLRKITLPSSVTSIGHVAFKNCTSLSEITIPSSVTSIGHFAFENCTSLSKIDLSLYKDLPSLGVGVFMGCSNLTSIISGEDSSWCFKDGMVTDKANTTLFAYLGSASSITLPNTYTTIKDGAFSGCTRLSKITIPSSVTSIGDLAFNYCESLSEITISSSVTSIGVAAFQFCKSLSEITIPTSVASIGKAAFFDCSSLSEITIPSSVTSIGEHAFNGCSRLTTVNYNGTKEEWESIDIDYYNDRLKEATINYLKD